MAKDPPFFSLPLELRKKIYTQAFLCSTPHGCYLTHGLLLTLTSSKIYKPFSYTPSKTSTCGKTSLPFLRTCKIIHREATKVFHEMLEVRIHLDGKYRSAVEIKGMELGDIENLGFLRNVRGWDVTVRLNSKEDVEGLVEQLEAFGRVVEGREGKVEWRRLSVQVMRYEEAPESGERVLGVLRRITGVESLEEVRDQWREETTVFDYQAPRKR